MKIEFLPRFSALRLPKSEQRKILRLTAFQDKYQAIQKAYMFNCIAIPSLSKYKYEMWSTSNGDDAQHDQSHNVEISRSGVYTFMRIVTPELTDEQLSTSKDPRSSLAKAGYDAYKELFQCIVNKQAGNILRLWNYVPNILQLSEDEIPQEDRERYRQFNAGRYDAYEESAPRDNNDEVIRPAATGIGSHNGPLVIEALMSTNPVFYVENPRQIPAYHYPPEYGTRSPAFSRGTLHISPAFTEMYISGTASIVKAKTVHIGDAKKQVDETFANINALISQKNLQKYNHAGFKLSDLQGIRVYIKNKSDYRIIRQCVEKYIGNLPAVYLNDDICRPNLLLEIEAVAKKTIEPN